MSEKEIKAIEVTKDNKGEYVKQIAKLENKVYDHMISKGKKDSYLLQEKKI